MTGPGESEFSDKRFVASMMQILWLAGDRTVIAVTAVAMILQCVKVRVGYAMWTVCHCVCVLGGD